MRDVDRQAVPLYVVWELTLKCDLACIHCGSRAGRARPDELTTDEALAVVGELHAMGTKEISLIGGEAYLRDDWATIVQAIAARGITCGVVSGGRGIDRALAAAMKDAGVDGVSISVDGLEATHDALRGVRGSWRAALDALGHLEAVGLRHSINSQINRASVRELEPLCDVVHPLGIFGWQLSMTVPMGRAVENAALLLEPWQMIETFAMLSRLEAKTRALGIMLWPGNNVGYFGPYEERLRRGTAHGHTEGCGAGRTTMGIEANGDVKGCPSLPSAAYVGGNVRARPLREIWERAEPLRFTRERSRTELTGFCATCYYAEECMAGCSWTSHVFFGQRGDNPYCHHRALERLQAGVRERLVMREAALEKVPFDHGRFDVVLEPFDADALARTRRIAETGEGFVEDTVVLPSPRPSIHRGWTLHATPRSLPPVPPPRRRRRAVVSLLLRTTLARARDRRRRRRRRDDRRLRRREPADRADDAGGCVDAVGHDRRIDAAAAARRCIDASAAAHGIGIGIGPRRGRARGAEPTATGLRHAPARQEVIRCCLLPRAMKKARTSFVERWPLSYYRYR